MDSLLGNNIKAPTGLKQIAIKVPRLRTIAKLPKGPREFNRPTTYLGGPGAPPLNFVVGQTSASEWNLYWAYAKEFGVPADPRQPPFYGGWPYWAYQVPFLGSYTRAPGSAVVDFVIYTGHEEIGIRLQTIRYHYVTDAAKQAYDALQLFNLSRIARIYDVQEEDVLGDPTGAKYIITAKKSLGLIDEINPILGGIDPRRTFPVNP